MQSVPGTPEFDELEVLAQLVDAYEDHRWPIGIPSPLDAIRFRMEQAGLSERDMAKFLGEGTVVSEVLSGKVPLTLEMARRLHHGLGIPADSLLTDPDSAHYRAAG